MSKILVITVIILGAIALAFLIRTFELSKQLSGRREDVISDKDNNFISMTYPIFLVIYLSCLVFLIARYGKGIPPAGSEHGQKIDMLFDINWSLILTAFTVTHILLFVFARRYRRQPGRKAYYYPHNPKLELLWTAIPALVLTGIVIMGLKTWHQITSPAGPEAINVEIFSEQFKWTARYSGADNKLGEFDYKLTTGNNVLGLVTSETLDEAIKLMEVGADDGSVKGIKMMEAVLNDPKTIMVPEDREKMETDLGIKSRLLRLLYQMKGRHDAKQDKHVYDDVIETDTLHMVVNKLYDFHFRAKDVIHSAYFPHFRAQMNTVPGMTTHFKIKPIFTTEEMRKKTGQPEWNYALICNKVCGSAHYKMKMIIVVETQEQFDNWFKKKDTFGKTYKAHLAELKEAAAKPVSDSTSTAPIAVVDTTVLKKS